MCSANLDDILPLVGFRRDRIVQFFTAGIKRCFTLIAAAMYMAEGKESLDD